MTTVIVSRNSLQLMLEDATPEKQMHIVGRALVALFDRQTQDEKVVNDTRNLNTIGFSAADAKSGSLTAKYYLKHKKLEDWQLAKWMKPVKGYARLCKYARQLNEISIERRRAKEAMAVAGVMLAIQ